MRTLSFPSMFKSSLSDSKTLPEIWLSKLVQYFTMTCKYCWLWCSISSPFGIGDCCRFDSQVNMSYSKFQILNIMKINTLDVHMLSFQFQNSARNVIIQISKLFYNHLPMAANFHDPWVWSMFERTNLKWQYFNYFHVPSPFPLSSNILFLILKL